MTDTQGLRTRRLKLMIDDPHCWYCGVRLDYVYPPRDRDVPMNWATIEHRFNRWHPGRTSGRGWSDDGIVLACRQCNQDVGRWADILARAELNAE